MMHRVRQGVECSGRSWKSLGKLVLASLLSAGGCVLGAGRANAQVKHMANPLSVDKKAIAAKSNDPQSVAALVDEVFNVHWAFGQIPAPIAATVKDRIERGEIAYRDGKRSGIEDQGIADTWNDVVDQLGGPRFLKTSVSQLRVLRMRMALVQPTFMGPGVARPDTAIGEPIGSALSAAQATNLILTLIDQKVSNPDFQVTPEEWDATSRQKVLDRVQEAQSRAAEARASGQMVAALGGRSYVPEKRRQLEQTLYPTISSLSSAQGLSIIQSVLARLGLK